DAVIDVGVGDGIEAVDLAAQRLRIVIGPLGAHAVEGAVEHADDFGRFVVDDAAGLLVPQRRHGDLAGIVRVARRVGLVQIVEAVDPVGRAVGKIRIVLERPAVLAQARNGVSDRDRVRKILDGAVDQGAVRPRTAVRDIQMVAPGLGLEAGRAVGGDDAAETAVGAAEVAGLAGLFRQLLIRPFAVDQNAHQAASPRASAAALRIAAILARYESGVRSLNTADPATKALAPARAASGAICGVMPPSISMSIGRPAAMARRLRTLSSAPVMNFWPPKPGLTDMTRIRSTMSMTCSTVLSGVPGFMVTPAFLPSARMACSERWMCGPASTCTVMMSAPALAKASRYGSHGAIIRWQSRGFAVCGRIALTTSGPIEMLGTKWPSMTSTWI